MKMKISLVALATLSVLVIGTKAQQFPEILTLQDRLRIFGTDSTIQLPSYDYATLERIALGVPGSKRKRPVNLVQIRLTINGEMVTLNMKPNTDLMTAGCLVHHHQNGVEKKLYPCSREISRCLYTGSIIGHNASWVAADICNGLQGIVSMENQTLNVSPLKFHHVANESGDPVHVVFRYQGNKHVCATTERAPDAYRIIHKPKRSASRRYIEASVVVDPAMARYHGNDTERYVNTVLNVASERFKDSSFHEDIILTMKDIYILGPNDGFGKEITTDAEKTLDKFCEWQATLPQSEKSDCFILLTR